LQEAEIVCAATLPADWRSLAATWRWLQTPSAGIDKLQSTGVLEPENPFLITTAVGIHAVSIGEYVFTSMLMFNRSWPTLVRLQDQKIWARSPGWYRLREQELFGQTLGIVGLGHIGRRIAQLGRAFGMRILASRRSVSVGEQDPDVDQLYATSQLREMLGESDYVVVSVPLTAETEHLIGEAELRAMRPHAYLVNIARGKVIDEQKLLEALRDGWIAGAGLDVFQTEPLPADSPFYSLPNVIMSPHISGLNPHYDARLTELFAENLRRYRRGETLLNLYQASRGY
jgi:phosphoglycerate dehydrogenase-like enzyme